MTEKNINNSPDIKYMVNSEIGSEMKQLEGGNVFANSDPVTVTITIPHTTNLNTPAQSFLGIISRRPDFNISILSVNPFQFQINGLIPIDLFYLDTSSQLQAQFDTVPFFELVLTTLDFSAGGTVTASIQFTNIQLIIDPSTLLIVAVSFDVVITLVIQANI